MAGDELTFGTPEGPLYNPETVLKDCFDAINARISKLRDEGTVLVKVQVELNLASNVRFPEDWTLRRTDFNPLIAVFQQAEWISVTFTYVGYTGVDAHWRATLCSVDETAKP